MLTHSPLAVLIYAGWTLWLVACIAALRLGVVLRGGRRPNAFSPWGDEVSPFSGRLCRAHANCVENLPVFAAIIWVAVHTGNGLLTDPLALWVAGARILPSVVHLASTSSRAVTLRFAFMAVQVAIQAWWVLQLARAEI